MKESKFWEIVSSVEDGFTIETMKGAWLGRQDAWIEIQNNSKKEDFFKLVDLSSADYWAVEPNERTAKGFDSLQTLMDWVSERGDC